MTLSFGTSPWLLALCAVAAALLAAWAYRRTIPPVSRGRRVVLGTLRFAALFLVLLLLFEPVVRRIQRTTEAPVLAVLVDDTQSLAVTGDSTALSASLRRALRDAGTANPDGEVRFFAFDRALRPLPADVPTDSLRRTGARTDLSAALLRVRETLRDVPLRGILLLSDGQYNTGRNPLYLAEQSPVPIHTVVLGDTTRRQDLVVERVTSNDLAYTGTEQPVQVLLRTEGLPRARVQVALSEEGVERDAASVDLPEGTASTTVDLAYTPEEAGLHRLEVRVTGLEGETTLRNNSARATVQVLDSQRRLLLLGAAPGPDLASVRQLLEQVPDFELVVRTPRPDGNYYEGPLPDSLTAFDALVLAGFPGPAGTPADREAVARAAAEVPTFFLLARQTDLAALQASFEGVLPAWPDPVREGWSEATFVPAPRAARHPAFDFARAAAPDAWGVLPPLRTSQSRWRASPDATVLATPRIRDVSLDDPLLATRRRSAHRSAALLGANAWRWRTLPAEADATEAPGGLWPSLFQGLVRWLTTAEDDRPVRVAPVRTAFGGDEAVAFNGQVYDESRQPVSDASLQLELIRPDGTRFPYVMESAGHGRYVAEVGRLPAGTYRYEARATSEADTLGTDRGAFAVGGLTLEYRETRADAALMQQIAARSGGVALPADSTGLLAARLAGSGSLTPHVVERPRERRLWQMPALLAVALLLLAAEWVLRKRSGMA